MHVMENLNLTLQSKNEVADYLETTRLISYEKLILQEILQAIEENNADLLTWFSQFGYTLRHLLLNVHAYRKGLEFGFTAIAFDQYGWLLRPQFLDYEAIILGNSERYLDHSTIHLGRGVNHTWTFALCYSFGVAGGGSHISVYDQKFTSRNDAFMTALNKLKAMMTDAIGHKDTTNYKQAVILATLADINKALVAKVQLALF